MSGVTHFERRGKARKVHPHCPICGKVCIVTPKKVAELGRKDFITRWSCHVYDCLTKNYRLDRVSEALEHMAEFGAAVNENI